MENKLKRPNITLHGGCYGEAKWAQFEKAHVLLFPSLKETQGLVAVEAIACGLPVVASDIDGIRSVFSDGVEGFLVTPGHAQAFADAVASLCRDPARWREMSEAGRRRFCSTFTLTHYLDGMRRVFLDCAGGGHDTR